MPILSGRNIVGAGWPQPVVSELTRRAVKRRERFAHQRIVREKLDRMARAAAHPVHLRARQVEADVAPRLRLRGVRLRSATLSPRLLAQTRRLHFASRESRMKAIAYRQSLPVTDADSLLDVVLPEPVPQGRDLLVKVEAISVNPVDTKIRQRVDPQGADKVLGWDAAGTVVAVGADVSLFKPGDAVYYAGAIDRAGSNAERQLVDERIVGRKPSSLDFAQAAAMPLTTITAWELLFDRLGVPRGSSARSGVVLVVGGAGGVGSMAIQLARRLTNFTVVATASRDDSRNWAYEMGAHHVVDHRGDLVAAVKAVAPQGVDVVLSLTHTELHFPALVALLKPQGKLGLIDDPAQPLNISLMKSKSLSLHWEFMYTRSLHHTDDMQAQHRLLNEVADLVDAGVLRTTLRDNLGSINAANLRRAHARLESASTIGKLVLSGF